MKASQQTLNAPLEQPADIARRWVKEVSGLVSPPDVCLRVFELVDSNRATAHALGEIISCDPSLAVRLLRLVNSSFYRYSRRIDTISRAITVVGISELYNLVIAVSAVTTFARIPSFIVSMDTFWRHSISCGIIARQLARRCGVLHPERLFVAGLLHDIGSLLIYHRAPETAGNLVIAARGNEAVLHRAEYQAFGFSHADLGGMLLDLWHLPDTLRQAVHYHHDPAGATGGRMEASILHIADALANAGAQGAFSAEQAAELVIDERACRQLGLTLDPALLGAIVDESRDQYRDALNALNA